jgi:hypothetical protein
MKQQRKFVALTLLTLLVGTCLMMANVASAQSIPKPSIPEFTVTVTDHSYDVKTTTTTTTDPYDGHIFTTTAPGYHAKNGSIELSIKNQPFTPYYDSNGYPIKLYYHYRAQGLNVNWHDSGVGTYLDAYFEATNSTYTTVTIGYGGNFFQTAGGSDNYKADGTIDFQVEAFIGYKNVTLKSSSCVVIRQEDLRTEFVGQTSGWSSTQTATIPNGAYTPTIPNPTNSPTPTVAATPMPCQDSTVSPSEILTGSGSTGPKYSWLEIALVIVVASVFAFLVAVIFVMRRKMGVLEAKQNDT